MKVKSMYSTNGNPVANQFEMEDKGNYYFQSYNTMIAKIDKNRQVWLDTNAWNYSRTTSKYRNIFLNEDTKECKEKIESGEYKFKNLN